jgi:chromosome partitioning protein
MDHVQETIIEPRLRTGNRPLTEDGNPKSSDRPVRTRRRLPTNRSCTKVRHHEGRRLAMRAESVEGARRNRPDNRGGITTGNGSLAAPPGISGKEVGQVEKRTMRRLVIANQKGGVGKTALAVNLSFHFHESGISTVCLDLDVQGNASHTLSSWKSGVTSSAMFSDGPSFTVQQPALIESDACLADLDTRSLAELAPCLDRNLRKLAGFELCLIDTAPSLGVGLASALMTADYVLCPLCLEYYSLQGLERMVTTIQNVRTVNPRLQFLGLVPSLVDRRDPRQRRHLEELLEAYPDLVSPAIGRRGSVAEGLALGVPVWRIQKTAAKEAAKEFRAVAAWVADRMGINHE